MAGLDDYLSDNPLPEEVTTPEVSIPQIPSTGGETESTDTSRIIIKQEAPQAETAEAVEIETGEALTEAASEVERDILRRQITAGNIPELSPEHTQTLQNFLESHEGTFDSITNDINSQMQKASEWSEDELITALGSITLNGELAIIGSEVGSNVSRIQSLATDEEIIIQDEQGEYVFETKKDAYLYLYYIKYSASKAQEFVSDISGGSNFNSLLLLYGTPILIFLYIGACTAGSLRRGWGKFKYRVFQRGQRITATARPEGAGENSTRLIGEFTEYTKRMEAIQLAKDVFKGNEAILEQFSKPRYLLFIDAYIEDVRPGRVQEQSFWRYMYNVINERGLGGNMRDILTSPYYFSTRDTVVEQLENAARTRTEIISYFGEGQGNSDIEKFRAFSELDHDVPNAEELRIRDNISGLQQSVLSGNLDYIFGMSFDEAKLEIQTRFGAIILENQPTPEKIASILGDGTASNPGEGGILVQNEVSRRARFLLDINQYNQTLEARTLEARMNGVSYNPAVIRGQLEAFFASIGNEPGQNRYTYYSASSIIEKILGGMDKGSALSLSEQETGDELRQRITDPNYIVGTNASHQENIKNQIITRANDIGSQEELRLFQEQVLDYIRNENGTYRTGYGDVGRRIERIFEQKQNAGLPETRIDGGGNPGPSPAPETPEELFRRQAIFEADGKMSPDARLLLESNLRLFVLNNPGVVGLSLNDIMSRMSQLGNIGELLDEVEKTNGTNTIRDITNAQAVIINSTKYLSQDIIERSLISTGSFSDATSINVDVQSGNIMVSVSENGTVLFSSSAGNIEQLEGELKTTFGITGDIPSWESISTIPSRITINIHRTRQYGLLRTIDDFFRRAR